MAKKKWMQQERQREEKAGTVGDLRAHYGVGEDENIPLAKMQADRNRLARKAEGGGKLTDAERKLYRQIVLALNYRKANQ